MNPSPETAEPAPRRIPDWAFAVGLVLASLLLLIAPLWTPESSWFLDPREVSTAGPEQQDMSDYLPLAEVRPEEEPPDASVVAVEEFGFSASFDDSKLVWGAVLRNTHVEYAVRFDLQVSVTGADSTDYDPMYTRTVPPGGAVTAGDAVYLDGGVPAGAAAEVAVVRLEWFALDGTGPVDAEEQPLSFSVDGVEPPDEPRGKVRIAATVENSAVYAVDPHVTVVFRRADGTLAGCGSVFGVPAVPPGESTRELWLWGEAVPADADLSLTEIVPAW
ncbi:hypothetical protein [Glycomyces sp. NPDC048151]|uniref:hypothetical protein n=1 Tax=Glycomyces sp. NPDC048151 TaxID=3364002 RepID=UPI00370FBB9F